MTATIIEAAISDCQSEGSERRTPPGCPAHGIKSRTLSYDLVADEIAECEALLIDLKARRSSCRCLAAAEARTTLAALRAPPLAPACSARNHRTRCDRQPRLPRHPTPRARPLPIAQTRIAFTGGMECNDRHRIWAVLDKARRQAPGQSAAAWRQPERRRAHRLRRPIITRCRRSSSSPIGPSTPRPRPSSATRARPVSSPSPVPASPPTSPTKPASWASRCGGSGFRTGGRCHLTQQTFAEIHGSG